MFIHQDDYESRLDKELVSDLLNLCEVSVDEGARIETIIETNDLFALLRDEDGDVQDSVSIIDNLDRPSDSVLQAIRRFKQDGTTQIIIVNVGKGRWIAVRLVKVDGKDHVEIAR